MGILPSHLPRHAGRTILERMYYVAGHTNGEQARAASVYCPHVLSRHTLIAPRYNRW